MALRFSRSLSALPAQPTVQRVCDSCAADEEQACCAVQPSLEVGPADDRFEREADAIAARTLSAAEPPTSTLAGDPSVQRRCAACSEEEPSVRGRGAHASPGLRIGASAAALTTGGQPLGATVRSFFETRMGRDLSGVRVHSGLESARLNGSIAARAFTYANHVWLGPSARPDVSFTMAHELAHVLQQTQPGPAPGQAVEAGASASAPSIQREMGDLRAFWLPDSAGSALGLHSVIHDKAVTALGDANPSIILEAPVPNATRWGPTIISSGWADLFQADAIIGLQRTCTDPPDQNSCLTDFAPLSTAAGFRTSTKAGSKFTRRGPTVTKAGDIDLSKAPSEIHIADMKPGHNPKETRKGVDQVGHYVKAIQDVAAAVNHQQAAALKNSRWIVNHGSPDWALNTAKIPPGWDATRDHPAPGPYTLKLRYKGADYRPTAGKTAAKRPITGRWVMTKPPKLPGVFVYFMRPDSASLKTAFGRKVETVEIQEVGKKLQKDVLAPLTKAPKAPKPRLLAAPDVRVAPARPMVRRQPATTSSDTSFDFAAWNEKRAGKDAASFKSVFEAKIPATEQEAIVLKGGAVESLDLLQAEYGSLGLDKPHGEAEMVTDAKQIRKFKFWAGEDGWIVGRLRSIFGGAFIRIMEVAQNIKKKISDKLGSFEFKPSGSALKRAAMKVAGIVLKYVGGFILDKTVAALENCVKTGIIRKVNQLIEDTFLETLEELVDRVKAWVASVTGELIADVEAFANKVLDPIMSNLQALADDLRIIGSIVSIVKDVLDGIRLGACVAGGLETVGVSCVVSFFDFVLSKLGVSPLDYAVSKIMSMCKIKKKISGFLAGVDFVANLPIQIASGIVTGVKGVLPEWAGDLLCDPKTDLLVLPFTEGDFKCDNDDPPPPPPPQQKPEDPDENAIDQPAPGKQQQAPPVKQGDIDPKSPRPGAVSPGERQPTPGGKRKVGKKQDDKAPEEIGGTPASSDQPVTPHRNAPPHVDPQPAKPGQGPPGRTPRGPGDPTTTRPSDRQDDPGADVQRGDAPKSGAPPPNEGIGPPGDPRHQEGQTGKPATPQEGNAPGSESRAPSPDEGDGGGGAGPAKGAGRRGSTGTGRGKSGMVGPSTGRAPPQPGQADQPIPPGQPTPAGQTSSGGQQAPTTTETSGGQGSGEQPSPGKGVGRTEKRPAPGDAHGRGDGGGGPVPPGGGGQTPAAPSGASQPQQQGGGSKPQPAGQRPGPGDPGESPAPPPAAGSHDRPAPQQSDRGEPQGARPSPDRDKPGDQSGGDAGDDEKRKAPSKPVPYGQEREGAGDEAEAKVVPRLHAEDTPADFKPEVTRRWRMIIESGLPSVAAVRATDPRECLERTITAKFTVANPVVEFTITLKVEFCSVSGPDSNGVYQYFYHFRDDVFIEELQLLIPARPKEGEDYIDYDLDPGPPATGQTA